eukprot:835846_1
MEEALSNFHKQIASKECKHNTKILIFEWTGTEPYSLPLKAFEKVISTIKHPISSWAPFTRQIKRKATKTTTMQHIYDDQKKKKKKNMSYKVNKDEIERKFGHRNHYVSIRNIENVIIYSSNNNKNHNENTKHYFMNSIQNRSALRRSEQLE